MAAIASAFVAAKNGACRPEAERIDGRAYIFSAGWTIEDGIYAAGETAMIPDRDNDDYPRGAPTWIASGDLEAVGEREETC